MGARPDGKSGTGFLSCSSSEKNLSLYFVVNTTGIEHGGDLAHFPILQALFPKGRIRLQNCLTHLPRFGTMRAG